MKESNDTLFTFGMGFDISIMKQNYKEKCFIQPISYDMEGKEDLFTGNYGDENQYVAKRIQVYQFYESEQNKQTKIDRQKQFEEQRHLQWSQLTEKTMKNFGNEIKILEQWTNKCFKEMIFHTDYHDYNIRTSEFDSILLKRSNIAIVIEDVDGNVFGGYLNSEISTTLEFVDNLAIGSPIFDTNAFLFSLRSNSRLKQPMKFNIHPQESPFAFILNVTSDSPLFSFGKGPDIIFNKTKDKPLLIINQKSFNYNGIPNALTGKEGYGIEVKQMFVIQMCLSEEEENKRKEKEREEEFRKKCQYDLTTKELNEFTKTVRIERLSEIKQIETLTGFQFDSVLFDSDICSWDCDNSEFGKRIFGKRRLVFIIEDTKGNVFGGYVNQMIDCYHHPETKDENYEKALAVLCEEGYAVE